MTLVGPGTWEAARAAVDCALTAVDLVLAGEPFAYACTRPPGHHAARGCYGGSCYLNNAAVAAAALVAGLEGPVAVLDIDAHHGNGTQEIFYERPDVLVGSVHVDPGAGWFPHFLGFADETGDGTNRNLPLPPGTGDEPWLAAVAELAEWAKGLAGLVVALGVDAAAGDPESPLEVSERAFRSAGALLGGLGLPTVVAIVLLAAAAVGGACARSGSPCSPWPTPGCATSQRPANASRSCSAQRPVAPREFPGCAGPACGGRSSPRAA